MERKLRFYRRAFWLVSASLLVLIGWFWLKWMAVGSDDKWYIESANGIHLLRDNYIPHPAPERVQLNAGQEIGPDGQPIPFLGVVVISRDQFIPVPPKPIAITVNGITRDLETRPPTWRKVDDGYAMTLYAPIGSLALSQIVRAVDVRLTVRGETTNHTRLLTTNNIAALWAFERRTR